MRHLVRESYAVQYSDPITVETGARVTVSHRDDRFTRWLWCRAADGREGWVPETILSSTQPGFATVSEAYEATELPVQAEEHVEVLKRHDGFGWARRGDGRLGWVPLAILEEAGPEEHGPGGAPGRDL